MTRPLRPEEVVAFLQNPWFPEGTSQEEIDSYRTDIKFRRERLLKQPTGERLWHAFGPEWYNGIWWDNANPQHQTSWEIRLCADLKHMFQVIKQQQPLVVVTFGYVSTRAYDRMRDPADNTSTIVSTLSTILHLQYAHPMAYESSLEKLTRFAAMIQGCTV